MKLSQEKPEKETWLRPQVKRGWGCSHEREPHLQRLREQRRDAQPRTGRRSQRADSKGRMMPAETQEVGRSPWRGGEGGRMWSWVFFCRC